MKSTGAAGMLGLAGENDEENSEKRLSGRKPPRKFADWVFLNGNIITMDDDEPEDITIADAVAIRNKKFEAVGCRADVSPWVGPNTNKINLAGRSIIPGLIDTHSHLQGYSLHHRGGDLVPELDSTSISGTKWDDVKQNTLETVRQQVKQTESGKWIMVSLPFSLQDPDGNDIASTAAVFAPWGVLPSDTTEPVVTRDELDEVAPDNPVYVGAAASAIFSGQALNIIKDYFGELGPRVHVETGASGVLLARAVKSDIIVPDLETLAELYRLESKEWTDYGITTWSSSFQGTRPLQAYGLLDSQGKMPHRLAFSHGVGITSSWNGPSFYRRFALPTKLFGENQRVWQAGVSVINTDHIPPNIESSLEPPEISPTVKAQEFSWIDEEGLSPKRRGYLRKVLKSQLRAGHRFLGNHIGGDQTLERYMNIIEEVAEEENMSLEEVRDKRHGADHFRLYPRPDQIPRLAKLGIRPSIGPKYIGRPELLELYPERVIENWQVPTKAMIEGGLRPAWEIDTHRITSKSGNAFWYLEKLITREIDGRVFGAHNRVDRLTALLTATRWAAEYVLREQELGTIEEGKIADLVILDKDFLSVSDNEIHTLRPEMVMVDGEVTATPLN